MNREEKAAQIEDLHRRFTETPLIVLADFKGSTVAQMNALRRNCEKGGVFFQVVKNSLAVRALEGTGKEKLADHFRGNIGVIVSNEDAIATAKLVNQIKKENEKLQVRAGFFDGDVLSDKAVSAVADLPSKEDLQAKLLATLQEAPRSVLGVLQAPARDLLYLLQNYASELEKRST